MWVHCCADDAPLGLLRGTGASGVAVDLDRVGAEGHDQLAEAYEAGETVLLGVSPGPREATVEKVARWLDMLGLEPGPGLGIAPPCGLAGATPSAAQQALVDLRWAAGEL